VTYRDVMSNTTDQQAELGSFLRSRRAAVTRADFDLPELRGGRTRGLRREEVAVLAGVSVTWYTWLEQGRNANPSRQVVDAIARELRFSGAEHAYALALAGFGPPVSLDRDPDRPVPEHLSRLLDGWSESPAFAITASWDIVAWNRAYEALYPGVGAHQFGRRNLLWAVFMDPYVRRMLPEWSTDSAHFVGEFRVDYATHLSSDAMKELVHDLRRQSQEFDEVWTRHGIERFSSRMRRFHHPSVGDLALEVHRLVLSDDPNLHLIVYSAVPGETDTAALATLIETASPPR
jgi:transcriptional regulator with XRE-family HTH domain